ncbi:MAG: YidC/Oxa1 family membrane protein insertase [Atopobiaceae bacterium]|nr:YidC/Oxa1 family membrane protein insertase [Atopobiaceae bacterium]
MTQATWNIVVQPLVYMIELVYSIFWRFTGVPGIAIIGVSIAVNLFCLPLYQLADAAQERERQKQASMERWVTHIKKHFSGDQQYMMLSTYYREQNYRPIQALVGSISLLLQIPFFTAAYSYLSNLEMLRGVSFLFLRDLGAPDAMFSIGGFDVNVMPIAMTLINCFSTYVYTKGLPLRDKVQAYGLAAIFLWLLYDSPSGLVFYWTCNQVFSLAKNVFMKVLKDPRTWALVLEQVAVVGAIGWLALAGHLSTNKMVAVVAAALVLFELLWVRAWRTRHADAGRTAQPVVSGKALTTQFLLGGLAITLLLGLLIPSAVIGDSPAEFLDLGNLVNPIQRVVHTTTVWGGVAFLWLGTFFFLSTPEKRPLYGLATWLVVGVCLVDYFLFGGGLGTLSTTLVYDNSLPYTASDQLLNLAAIIAVVVVLAFLWVKANRVVIPALTIVAVAMAVLSAPNVLAINGAYADACERVAADDSALVGEDGSLRPIYHLSRTEQNVVVIFLDRAISGYVPFILAERPELETQFDGFTYYPNTISFGNSTNVGAPALYGGYEYTPAAINARPDESLRDKHDEALLLMPTLFSGAGYRTTVVDPPYAGTYAHVSDLSIYDGLENTEALNLQDAYSSLYKERHGLTLGRDMNRRFFMHGLFKAMPTFLRGLTYDNGNYLSTVMTNPTRGTLLREYSELEVLPEVTDVTSGGGGFALICNETTHEPDIMQLPDYLPSDNVNNDGLEDMGRFTLDGRTVRMDGNPTLAEMRLAHYHVNMAALLELGKWFDWMREQGVYDNTRIIIVSDHGRGLEQFDGWDIDGHQMNIQNVNPLLMVKDFDAHGFTTSDEFMTNADVPAMAMEGVIEDPKNPFTGEAVTTDEKYAHDQYITSTSHWEANGDASGNTFETSDEPWYAVHDDIFEPSNWERMEEGDLR